MMNSVRPDELSRVKYPGFDNDINQDKFTDTITNSDKKDEAPRINPDRVSHQAQNIPLNGPTSLQQSKIKDDERGTN